MPDFIFAIPGDPNTQTGGYRYNRRIVGALEPLGWKAQTIRLPDTFPNPTPKDQAATIERLANARPDRITLIDGLAFGALAVEVVRKIPGRIIALVHHPLAEETGLTPNEATSWQKREQDAFALTAGIITTSPHTRTTLIEKYSVEPGHITVAIPGADRPDGVQSRADPPLILSVGTLTARKGHDILLRALAAINDLGWQATIVGSPDRAPGVTEDLMRLRANLGLEKRVAFTGELPDTELKTLFAKSSIFALATRYEGYGMVFAEAMTHGLPIVSTRAGAVRDTVPSDAGCLVPPEDHQAFAGALQQLLTEPSLYSKLADGSKRAGAALPTWGDTAQTVALFFERTMTA